MKMRCESHLPHFLAIEFGVFPAIDGHWRVEGASDLDFLEVLQRRQYQSNPKHATKSMFQISTCSIDGTFTNIYRLQNGSNESKKAHKTI